MVQTPEVTLNEAPPASVSSSLEQPDNPEARRRLQAVDAMLFRIALDCEERVDGEQASINRQHAQKRQLLAETVDDKAKAAIERSILHIPRLPRTYRKDIFHVEVNYAYTLVDKALSLAERAQRAAAKLGGPAITEIIISTDLDGTQVPFGDGDDTQLRLGTVPAIFCLNEILNPRGVVVKLDTHSDRAQHEQEHGYLEDDKRDKTERGFVAHDRKVATLFHELKDAGYLNEEGITSTKDGVLAQRLHENLRSQRGRNREITPQILSQRAAAIGQIVGRRTLRRNPDKAYHEKGVIAALRVAQDPPTRARVFIDDAAYVKHFRQDSPRVAGMHINTNTRKKGGMQPLTPNDVLYYS